MRKNVLLLVALFLFAGCASPSPTGSPPANGKKNVVAVNFPCYDLTRSVAGDAIGLTMLLPPGAESHGYEPSPANMLAIKNADLFIYVGGESDAWVERILASLGNDVRTLALTDCIDLLDEELVEGMEDDADEGDEPELDEHVWTSPRNAAAIAADLANELTAIDPANASLYAERLAAARAQFDTLDAAFRDVVDHAARTTIVFGDRFPFRYFAEAYGLRYYAAFPGCATETEPSAATVKFLIDKVKAEQIPVVFHLELSSAKTAETIAESTGAKVLQFHACHNITADEFKSGKTMFDFMTANVEALKEALQ